MGTQSDKARTAILKALDDLSEPGGASQIVGRLAGMGVDLRPRTVRFYLLQLDKDGLTRLVSRRQGRVITDAGREELARSNVIEKVGFVDARVDLLSYQMSFDLESAGGTIIANTALIRTRDLVRALAQMEPVFAQGLGMGRRMAIAHPGDTIGDLTVPRDSVGLATICSVTLNGILLKKGIPITSRFGGLLEIRDRRPTRFVELIEYKGTTLDPLEAFVVADMTRVREAAIMGMGLIGASFREIPSTSTGEVRRINTRLKALGLGGVIMIGQPNQPLLDIPVAAGRTGIIVLGGLNPIAAVHETGTQIPLKSLASVEDFSHFPTYEEVCSQYLWV